MTPDRAALRALFAANTPPPYLSAVTALALLDALDAAEAEVARWKRAFIGAEAQGAEARAAARDANDRLDKVRALHQPDGCDEPCCTCTPDGTYAHPCPTRRAADGAP